MSGNCLTIKQRIVKYNSITDGQIHNCLSKTCRTVASGIKTVDMEWLGVCSWTHISD